MSQWAKVLNKEEIDARFALTASLDPSFARSQRAFYESRTVNQLHVLMSQAWNCNDSDGYQLSRSFLAISE